MLHIVVLGYRALRDERIVDVTWPEDKITRELYARIYSQVASIQVSEMPFHQYPLFPKKPNRGRPRTIDFVFRKGFEESPYLAFECKIVDDKVRSARLYVNEGIMRYVSGIYAPQERLGAMIGYLVKYDHKACVCNINTIVKAELSSADCLESVDDISSFESLYKSVHKRSGSNLNIMIYHIFMLFD